MRSILQRLSALAGLVVLVALVRAAGAFAPAPLTWTAEVRYTFPAPPAGVDAAAEADRFQAQLSARLARRGVHSAFRRLGSSANGLDYTLSLEAKTWLDDFKQTLFNDLDPLGGLLGGPALLVLQGDMEAGETLVLALESNPSTGYLWTTAPDPTGIVREVKETQLEPKSPLLGAPMRQTLTFSAARAGQVSLTLQYARAFEPNAAPTRTITVQAARLADLADLTSPIAPAGLAPLPAQSPEPSRAATTLPTSFDWHAQGKVTPIRNQGSCGSCWAFSTVGAIESAAMVKSNTSLDLSEQYLVSCNNSGWSCSGGWYAHDYHLAAKSKNTSDTVAGAVLETSFPYTATNAPCGGPYSHPYRLASWNYIGSAGAVPSDDAIKQAIYTYGPVSVGVCVGSGFQAYHSGVFATDERTACNNSVNHAVVLTGWNDTDNSWVLRNSWGTNWGESGYMRILRTVSNVGLGPTYVVFNQPASTPRPALLPALSR